MALLPKATFKNRRKSSARSQSLVGYEQLERKDLLTTITVATADEFVDALATASADETVERIRFRNAVDAIQLEATAEYSGTQTLTIDGNDVAISPVEDAESTFDLFKSNGGGNLILRELTFLGGLDGVHVEVPETATGNIQVRIIDSVIGRNSEFGLHVDDLGGSEAGVNLYVRDSVFAGNGGGAADFDGIRVDERGEGGIRAAFLNSRVINNGDDGVEFDEAGEGGVRVFMQRTRLNGNGGFSEESVGDGLNVNEADGGNVWVTLRYVGVSNNTEQGIDLHEAGEGSIVANFGHVAVNGNSDDGIKLGEAGEGGVIGRFHALGASENGGNGVEFDEADDGGVRFVFNRVQTNSNSGEGVQIKEADAGWLSVLANNLVSNRNGGNGLTMVESGDGTIWFLINDSRFNGNEGDGIEVEENDTGDVYGVVFQSTANGNAGFGIQSTQNDEGGGRIYLRRVRLLENGLGPVEATNLDIFGLPDTDNDS